MTPTVRAADADSGRNRKTSTPPEGYTCKLCETKGHWIQQCPRKRKRKKSSSSHVPVPGVDPSPEDIERARRMQKIDPPNCLCGVRSRLKKVKKSRVSEDSRANGVYFFFCAKGKDDETKCRFARPAEDLAKPKRERTSAFRAKDEGRKKGEEFAFRRGDDSVAAGKTTEKAAEGGREE